MVMSLKVLKKIHCYYRNEKELNIQLEDVEMVLNFIGLKR
jgi:uncharacterized protein (DUF2164 family)